MEGRNESEKENGNIGHSPSISPSYDSFGLDSSVQDLPPNNLKNTGKDLVQL
jgi:hypothetical protein